VSRLASRRNGCRRCSVRFRRALQVLIAGVLVLGSARAEDDQTAPAIVARGNELFRREWLLNDSRAHGGDGLGPVYNETSCIACHFQGGPGGSGPVGTNVQILSGGDARAPGDLHPGFKSAPSVILHRYAVDPDYRAWRYAFFGWNKDEVALTLRNPDSEIRHLQGIVFGGFFLTPIQMTTLINGLSLSSRNPPALFGAGLIDSIPDGTIIEFEKQKFPRFPDVHGRASRLNGDRIGRFGWKASIESLREVVLLACANELGLELPEHHQPPSPLGSGKPARGLDLTLEECDALVSYVKHLPVAKADNPSTAERSRTIAEGGALFESIGCATCHLPKTGPVEGMYSDLLLHEMGPALASPGGFNGKGELGELAIRETANSAFWRTAPLWGFRDSGPYLHDGRADNLEQAVAFHGGEAAAPARGFFELELQERVKIQAFLRSLIATAATDGKKTAGPSR
jgi:CxxC motif-containing protein (DUF1111 family)